MLVDNGIDAVAYHAGLSVNDRKAVQDRFMSRETGIIVATNAFGMGIDRPDVRFVVHADVPDSLEAYYQEVGRAGRDGDPAHGLLLFNYADKWIPELFIDASHPPPDFLRQVFGRILAATSERGLAYLAFADGSEPRALSELADRWPRAALDRDDPTAARIARQVFSERGGRIVLAPVGTNFQVKVCASSGPGSEAKPRIVTGFPGSAPPAIVSPGSGGRLRTVTWASSLTVFASSFTVTVAVYTPSSR
jgi:hypothetical protein